MFRFLPVFLLFPFVSFAQAHNPQPFGLWVQELREEAAQKGVEPALFDRALHGVEPIPRVIELDRKQPESTLSFEEYMQKVVPDARVQKARAMYAENRTLLDETARRYGVPAPYIVALWGVESNFGQNMGSFSIVEALATLAYDGRRAAYFRKELLNALTILQQGHTTVEDMKGSWAGAMGQCQFMPTSFLNFAQDGDGDGHKDIWTNKADVYASIANYLSSEGWKEAEGWGARVRLPKGFDESLADIKQENTREEWARLGVKAASGALPAGRSSLVAVGRNNAPPYYLVTGNYKVILKWNRSRYFATAVGTLAERIAAGQGGKGR